MEFTRSCWGPPVITLWGLLAFGLGAAILLVLTWSRFGTKSVLAPWSLLVSTAGWLVAVRMWYIHGFATPSRWWFNDFATYAAGIVPAMLLTTLASAALWAVFPRLPRTLHVALTFIQFLIACTLAAVVTLTLESWMYGSVR
jgi:hypothetical protein